MKSARLIIGILSVFIALFLTTALTAFKVDSNMISLVASGLVTAIIAAFDIWENRHKSQQDKFDELIAGGSFANPWYISLYFLFVLLFLPRILTYPIVWITYRKLGWEYFPPNTSPEAIMLLKTTASAWLLIVGTLPILTIIGKRMAHRIKRGSAIWLSLSLFLSQIVSLLFTWMYFWVVDKNNLLPSLIASWKDQTFIITLQLFAVWVGCLWAKLTQDEFTIGRYFGQANEKKRRELFIEAQEYLDPKLTTPDNPQIRAGSPV